MESTDAVTALGALAQENRLEVFRLLVQSGVEGLPAGEVAGRLGIAAPTLSFHLAQLRHAGLVHVRREGRSLIYAANYDGMRALIGFLTDNCCGKGRPARAAMSEPPSADAIRHDPVRRNAKGGQS